MFKIFEQVINNRIKSVLSFAGAYPGAREGRSSVDQFFILKSVIQQKISKKTDLYCTYSIEKAFYDT